MAYTINTLIKLANINTHWQNPDGIQNAFKLITPSFQAISDTVTQHALPPIQNTTITGNAITVPTGVLLAQKRPTAPFKILLSIHIDTVYPQESSFQRCKQHKNNLHGPGVCDAKGGLLILLEGLTQFEQQHPTRVGWTTIINADEEIGSPRSSPLLLDHAKHHNIGLIFEPTLPNGNLVSQRKGSSNITLISHGISAHAGRHFFKGTNAITQLTHLIQKWTSYFPNTPHRIINIGQIHGGTATNQVPDLAISKINIRTTTTTMMDKILNALKTKLVRHPNILLKIDTYRPPKPFDSPTQHLFKSLQSLDPTLKWESSGGVCDGNTIASIGLPTIDTFGPTGNNIHTHKEYVDLKSINKKIKLLVSFLKTMENKNI